VQPTPAALCVRRAPLLSVLCCALPATLHPAMPNCCAVLLRCPLPQRRRQVGVAGLRTVEVQSEAEALSLLFEVGQVETRAEIEVESGPS